MAWNERYKTELKNRRTQICQADAAGADKRERQHAAGKLTARERLSLLFDKETFHELDQYAESGSTDFGMAVKRRSGDGVVTGWGLIHGRIVYAAAQDATVLGGSLGKVHGVKICRIQDMAYENKCPIVFLIDSGGARVEEGVAALSGYSGIFRRNTRCSGRIPQIALLLGYSVGGSSYLPALCDFTFMTKKTARMFITGPGVVKEVIGEEISAEELGGYQIHSEVSGATDFVCEDDEEAIRQTRRFMDYIYPVVRSNDTDESVWEDKTVFGKEALHRRQMLQEDREDRSAKLEELVPDDQRKVYDVRQVIEIIVDKDSFYEVKEAYAKNLVIGFGTIDGGVTGVVANQPLVLGGSLDTRASEKAARFIRFCDCFSIPLLTLVDTPGFFPGKRQEEDGIIRRGAKLLYAYSEATVPKVTLVMRKAYGGAYIAMNSKDIGADLVYAWPIAQLAVLGAEGAVNVVFRKEIARAEDSEAERRQKIQEYQEKFMNPYFAARQGYIDEVISPEETKNRIRNAFKVLKMKDRMAVGYRPHGNIPL